MDTDPRKCSICFSCIHSSEFENSQEDSSESEARAVVPDRSQTPGEESSVSEYFSCVSSPGKLPAAAEDEFQKSQEDSPQPEARVVVPDHSQTPGEEPSVSEYFSCVSSPGKLPAAAEDGKGDTKAGRDEQLRWLGPIPTYFTFPSKTGKGFRAEELRLKPLQRDKLGVCFQ
ncbi:protein FAM170A-like [Manis pentadactyla]|uniref:protein FAM170A-like n=1 Tax=Manis pentadactyla TaxID=143292 RepID=UPI00255C406A|nr:protein FAM170A-like [Manis pentadactyla]